MPHERKGPQPVDKTSDRVVSAALQCPGTGGGKSWGELNIHISNPRKISIMPVISTFLVLLYWACTLFIIPLYHVFSSSHSLHPPLLFPTVLSLSNPPKLCVECAFSEMYSAVPADDRYWVFREADVLPGYPQPLHQYGQGVPAHSIDTAIWWEPNGYTYFFTDDRYIAHILPPYHFP